MLEWLAIPFSKGAPQPRDRTHISCTSGGFFTICATREAQVSARKWVTHWDFVFDSL